MICTEIWNGQGLGNQLHAIVMARVLAADLGVDFGIAGVDRFKGHSFMKLDFGNPVVGGFTSVEGGIPEQLPDGINNYFLEKRTNNERGVDIRGYDDVKKIKDSTKIEGLWQGELYYKHHRKDIRKWLATEPLDMPKDLCIIGFRGGEYVGVEDLFLKQDYWDAAIKRLRIIKPDIRFKVVTDDPDTARKFFPDFEITHEIGMDWREIRYCHWMIIANSSFYILPAFLNSEAYIIAPRYWAGRNVGYWKMAQNQYDGWHYL